MVLARCCPRFWAQGCLMHFLNHPMLSLMGEQGTPASQDIGRLCSRVGPTMMCDHALSLAALSNYVLPTMVAKICSAMVGGLSWPAACHGWGSPTQALIKCSLQVAG